MSAEPAQTAEQLEKELNAAVAEVRLLEPTLRRFREAFTSYMLGKLVDGTGSMHTMQAWTALVEAAQVADVVLRRKAKPKST